MEFTKEWIVNYEYGIAQIVSNHFHIRKNNLIIRPLSQAAIPVKATTPEYKLASQMALDLDHHLFDTLYHALALREQATLITADRRYFKKAADLGLINLLGDFDARLSMQAG
jgi:predicted nucleic acid-binding protein